VKSNEHIKQLIKLSEENPELDIKAEVDSDCVPSEDFNCWLADFGKSKIDEYWEADDETVIGESEILDHIRYKYDGLDCFPDDDEEQEKFIQDRYDKLKAKGEIKEAIFVEIKP
jgi:hypothetical protein